MSIVLPVPTGPCKYRPFSRLEDDINVGMGVDGADNDWDGDKVAAYGGGDNCAKYSSATDLSLSRYFTTWNCPSSYERSVPLLLLVIIALYLSAMMVVLALLS